VLPVALSSAQHDFLNFLEQYWYEHGALPTKDYCTNLGLDTNNLWANFSKPAFRDAVLSRGISLATLEFAPGDPRGKLLTEEQLAVANVMLDLRDNRSQKKKLQELQIPTQKWEAWLRDPAFSHYIRTRAENALGDNQHEAHLALVERVRSGDVSAIKYFNELTGRYLPQRSNNVDVGLVLLRVVEILQKHISDPELQEAIGQDLMQLAAVTIDETSAQKNNVVAIAAPVGRAPKGTVVI
jgi:hypothetical protein